MTAVARATVPALAVLVLVSWAGPPDPAAPPADHHMHVWSPDAVDALLRIQRAVGQTVMTEEEARPLGAAEALAALDSAGIRRAALLSTAYFFGIPDVEFEDERARVRAENDYVARQVAEAPDRLVGFCAFNPKTAYALEELERCAEMPEIAGVKLQLANSNFDFRDTAQVARLREVFRAANARGMALVVHLRTRRQEFGRAEVETFLDRVLPAAPDVPVQVAHMGGRSGWDAGTRAAVDAFAEAFEEHPDRTARVFFDLAAVPVPPYRARGDSALLEQVRRINERVAEAVRRIGPDRIVYGTDWPELSAPGYLNGIRDALPMEPAELRDLLDDTAPYLR